ncbi:MAG: hypothetical protein MPJ50_01440 [Pirellulales bacterium]|nr:hypothetical protein [Pirellulales bacterium]
MSWLFVVLLSSHALAQVQDLPWRNIGPANMAGRVIDVEALNDDYRFALMASASGGVWLTKNAGTTWTPIFENYGVASIGDVAICQSDPDILWVGTGEANNRNSVAWGDGVYKSTDGGETFTNMGLKDTHQIARIRIHPDNPDVVYVAAAGHLWGYSGRRGLFKTTDGGKTWSKLTNGLPNHSKIGANDLVMDPNDPDTLYLTMYQRRRTSFRYDGGSRDGGIFKSTNGGRSWKKLTSGLPTGPMGRIGLDIYAKNPQILVAIVETELDPDDPLYPGVWGTVRGAANRSLEKPQSGIYRSEDGGESWSYLNTYNNRAFYFSKIRINPSDDQRVYVMTQRFQMSSDGGRTLRGSGRGIHGDYHAMWIDPHNPDRFYIGNDGGLSLSHDHGRTYNFFDNVCICQFYAIGADMRQPYWVYGGLQDNGTWSGPSNSRDSRGVLNDHWFSVSGGDGFYAQIDPTDWTTVYSESQGGNIGRRNVRTRQSSGIKPRRNNVINYDEVVPDPAPDYYSRGPFRFNWNAPIHLSPHNPHTVYFGGNYLFKSVDRGDTWKIISPDLSTNNSEKMKPSGGINPDNTAAEFHGTVVTISESPLTQGVVWVGTDDGNVQVTRDDGVTWTDVTKNLETVPAELWVSRVEASHFDPATAYVSVDGHRSDDFTPYVLKTTDYGQTWELISTDLPAGHSVYVVREDAKNRDLLFVGTEFSVFYSLDGGQSWNSLLNNMPNVAFHDLLIHPRDNDLIAGTHGRGIWIMDNITPLQQLTAAVRQRPAHLFQPRPAVKWLSISRGGSRGQQFFSGDNPSQGAVIDYYLAEEVAGEVRLEISNVTGDRRFRTEVPATAGLHRFRWDFQLNRTGRGQQGRGRQRRSTAGAGQYRVTLTVGDQQFTRQLVVEDDPMLTDNQ